MDELGMRRLRQRSDSMQKLADRVASIAGQLTDLEHDVADMKLPRVEHIIASARALLGELEQYLRDRR